MGRDSGLYVRDTMLGSLVLWGLESEHQIQMRVRVAWTK